MQEAKLTRKRQGVIAHVGVSLALTGMRAGEVAKVLIVMLRTLAPAVTDVCHVQTDSGATTAVETWACWTSASMLILILVMWTIIDTVTANIQGQAVART